MIGGQHSFEKTGTGWTFTYCSFLSHSQKLHIGNGLPVISFEMVSRWFWQCWILLHTDPNVIWSSLELSKEPKEWMLVLTTLSILNFQLEFKAVYLELLTPFPRNCQRAVLGHCPRSGGKRRMEQSLWSAGGRSGTKEVCSLRTDELRRRVTSSSSL